MEFLKQSETENSLGDTKSPAVIICPSGKRCTEVLRAIAEWSKDKTGQTAKLFAKHFKVAEQIERLKKGLNDFSFFVTSLFFTTKLLRLTTRIKISKKLFLHVIEQPT